MHELIFSSKNAGELRLFALRRRRKGTRTLTNAHNTPTQKTKQKTQFSKNFTLLYKRLHRSPMTIDKHDPIKP